jgi:hypothetical protein
MTGQVDPIYDCIERLHCSTPLAQSPESLLSLIESRFRTVEPLHSQNFLTFLAEDLAFFQPCSRFQERFVSLASFLQEGDALSSRSCALVSLTKFWISTSGVCVGFQDFVALLFKLTRDSDLVTPPHLRLVASHCLCEIRSRRAEAFVVPPEESLADLTETTLSPSAFGQLSLIVGGKSAQMEEYYQKRWWFLSPFENIPFLSFCKSYFPAVPSDPLLLHSAILSRAVSKETALAMMNSPLVQFGVTSVILAFATQFDFDGSDLFSPFDSSEVIASKCSLLPSTLAAFIQIRALAEFVTLPMDSPIVSAVFSLAGRFESQDLFDFYRRFYPDTPQFDSLWVKLYESKPTPSQRTLRSFFAEHPARRATAKVLLSSDDRLPTLAVISKLTDESLVPLLTQFTRAGCSEEEMLAAAKIAQFPGIISAKPAKPTKPAADLEPLPESKPVLRITNKIVTTSNQNRTAIVLQLEAAPELRGTIYGVAFTLSNPDFFEADGSAAAPSITNNASVQFEMKPKKIGTCQLKLKVVYTNSDGDSFFFRLNEDSNLVVQPVSFLSVVEGVEFGPVWEQGDESRVISQLKFPAFVEAFSTTVFGVNANKDANSVQGLAVTPDGKYIAIRGVANANNTTVQFKAPSIDLLQLADDFVRRLK